MILLQSVSSNQNSLKLHKELHCIMQPVDMCCACGLIKATHAERLVSQCVHGTYMYLHAKVNQW